MLKLTAFAAISTLLLSTAALSQDAATATATLTDASGATLGTIELMDTDGGVHLSGTLAGVPNGEHGFHIHETGACDASTKFESAGAHFEPGTHKHGMENPEGPHAGDLQNVTADDNGNATVDLQNPNATLAAGERSVADADGSAVVLHADPDDYETDPSGNSGDRIACGVIEVAQ